MELDLAGLEVSLTDLRIDLLIQRGRGGAFLNAFDSDFARLQTTLLPRARILVRRSAPRFHLL